jgi:DNA-binding transcriptional regulator YiaG
MLAQSEEVGYGVDMKKVSRSTKLKRAIVSSKAHDLFKTAKICESSNSFEVKEFCQAYHVTQDVFTRLTGFSPRAVAHWAQGRKPSASTDRRLAELARLFETLQKFVSGESLGRWLKEPNPAFDGSTPLQVIERGETDRIWRMLYELESGEPG